MSLRYIASLESRIRPENTVSLKELLGDDPETVQDYEYIRNLVQVNLFSRFEQRKKYAMNKLYKYFSPWIKICTITDKELLYAYLSVTKDRNAFLLIGTYDANRPALEELPSEEEKKKWPKK